MVWISFDEHTFSHPWDKVVEAALRKYPNPETPNVLGTDIYERKIDENGKLHSKRIISSIWRNSYTQFLAKFTGFDITKTVHAVELSVLDPKEKVFELMSCNYNFMDYIVIDEKLVYTQDKVDPTKTLLQQQWNITCKNISFTSFLEDAMGTTMKTASIKGREGIEFVINQVREEVEKISLAPALEVAATAFKDVQHSLEGAGKRWEENLHDELNEFIKKSIPEYQT